MLFDRASRPEFGPVGETLAPGRAGQSPRSTIARSRWSGWSRSAPRSASTAPCSPASTTGCGCFRSARATRSSWACDAEARRRSRRRARPPARLPAARRAGDDQGRLRRAREGLLERRHADRLRLRVRRDHGPRRRRDHRLPDPVRRRLRAPARVRHAAGDGYRNRFVSGIVLQQAAILAVLGFLPGMAAAWLLYRSAAHGDPPAAAPDDRSRASRCSC